MESINITIVVTTECNLKCKYCINNSGNDLKKTDISRWNDSSDIIKDLIKISKIRDIEFIKFFGGEPMLEFEIIKDIINNQHLYSSNNTKFAMTINGYNEISNEDIMYMINNHMIINISLDGPQEINDIYRVSKSGEKTSNKVIKNINKIKSYNYPFAIMAVLDERIINYDLEILDLCYFFNDMTSIFKIEPIYNVYSNTSNQENIKISLLNKEKVFINKMFNLIFSLKIDDFIYENNFFRTLNNLIYGSDKEYVCSAFEFLALFPGNAAFSCYNLGEEFKISDNILNDDEELLDNKMKMSKEMLKIDNFPQLYKDIQYYGDFCPKDGTSDSFAYLYRLTMVEEITKILETVEPGSINHFAILSYLKIGKRNSFFDTFNGGIDG